MKGIYKIFFLKNRGVNHFMPKCPKFYNQLENIFRLNSIFGRIKTHEIGKNILSKTNGSLVKYMCIYIYIYI